MRKTLESEIIQTKLLALSRAEKQNLLYNSNLNDREVELLSLRFINGKSLKECSEVYGLEINTVSKNQQKAMCKLYQYLIHK